MADKKVEITQDMCRQAQLMIKGGATNKEAASFLGVSPATVSRIRTANYDPFKYQQNTEARRKEEKVEYKLTDPGLPTLNRFVKKAGGTYSCVHTGVIEDKSGIVLTPEGPLTREELRAAAREFQDAANQVPGQMEMDLPTYPQIKETDMNKLMRFLAGKIGEITTKLDKLNDNLCQILRRMDK